MTRSWLKDLHALRRRLGVTHLSLQAWRTVLSAGFALLLFGWAVGGALTTDAPLTRHRDAQVVYVGGRCLVEGVSPYDQETFRATWVGIYGEPPAPQRIFAYPPTILPLAWPLGLLPQSFLGPAIDTLNVVALILVLLGASALWGSTPPSRRWLGAGLALLVGAASGVLLLGQTSLIALAGLVWALHFAASHRVFATALCALVAVLKPQIVLLPLAWAFLQGPRAGLVLGGALAGLCGVATTLLLGSWEWIGELAAMLRDYGAYGQNQPDQLVGLHHLLGLVGWEQRGWLLPAGLLGLVIAWFARWGRPNREGGARPLALAATLTLTACLAPLHPYDLVVLMPLGAGLAVLPASVWLLLPYLLAARPAPFGEMLSTLTGRSLPGTTLASLGVVALACGVLVRVAVSLRTSLPPATAGRGASLGVLEDSSSPRGEQ